MTPSTPLSPRRSRVTDEELFAKLSEISDEEIMARNPKSIIAVGREIERRTLERAAHDLHYRFYYSAEDVVRALMEPKQ